MSNLQNNRIPLEMTNNNMACSKRVVCVLDASSYVGFWLVRGLLQKGYVVHAAACSFSGVKELLHELNELERTDGETVRVFVVDILDYQSITNALRCCSALFYSLDIFQRDAASVYDEDVADIEIRGAHNVLEACGQIDTIERVVFTSSVSAIIWREDRSCGDSCIDERQWSDPNLCKKLKLWHALGKTMAEKTAWALAVDRGLSMITVNVPLVVGPAFTQLNPGPTLSYLKGAAEMYEDGVLASVDVRFLSEVQITLLEDEDAFGRHVCYDNIINSAETAVALAKRLRPLLALPEKWEDETVYKVRLSNKKLKGVLLKKAKANTPSVCTLETPPLLKIHKPVVDV